MLWRQGDVFIERIWAIPRGAVQRRDLVLAAGELTGHSHRVADPEAATLYELNGQLLLVVHRHGAKVVHEEHGPIELSPGNYRVWRQREFDPRGSGAWRSPGDADPFMITRAAMDSGRTVLD